MDITTSIIMGFVFAIGFVWPISKLPRSVKVKLNGYGFAVDLFVGIIMTMMFYGTATGMIIATIATVLFTAYMSYSTHEYGAKRLTLRGWREVTSE